MTRLVTARLHEPYVASAPAEILDRLRSRMLKAAQTKDTLGLRFAVIPGEILSERIVVNGLYEREYLIPLARVLEDNAQHFMQSCALDVGANIGNHACFLARQFGQVIAFEPGETAFHLLAANINLNELHNVEIVQAGLADKEGDLIFTENRQGNLGDSGFVTSNSGMSQPVRVLRGDDYLDGVSHLPVGFIKIDVQGFETQVIHGLMSTIMDSQPVIQFENNYVDASAYELLLSLGIYDFFAFQEAQMIFTNKHLRRLTRILRNRVWLTPYRGDTGYQDILAIPKTSY
jgi:FkbM family methyltransferase